VIARALQPNAEVEILDTLSMGGRILRAVAEGGMRESFGAGRMSWLFDLEYLLFARVGSTRRLGQALLYRLSAGPLLRAIESRAPDVVVATYPIASELLGRSRESRRLGAPVCSVITDLAGLRYWAHPGCDLHLVSHPESIAEVERIAGAGSARAVRGLTAPEYLSPPGVDEARRALAVPEDALVVTVSGGGWGVGDLAGAVTAVRVLPGVFTLCLCGRNEALRLQLEQDFGYDRRVQVLGFVEEMATVLAATDVLVHSTAGLTVLEGYLLGCRVISYGFSVGHVRLNEQAFARFGIADVASSPGQLQAAVEKGLAAPRTPQVARFAALPPAAMLILELGSQHGGGT
jgi:UDP-N-acetylglucosamine:LPS N-acetylglucosamine transferase